MLSTGHFRSRARGLAVRRQRGVSLVELMIAMTITLFIMGVMTAVFVSNSRARSEVERTNQELENARYALQQLSDDLQMAGYWAEFNIGASALTPPSTLPDPCTDSTNLAALAEAMPLAVQGYHQGSSSPIPSCINDYKPNTDVLVVRRVSGCAAGADPNCSVIANAPYFQASECANPSELQANGLVSSTISGGSIPGQFLINTNINTLTLHLKDCSTTAAVHQFLVHIYYVAKDDQSGDGIPTLKRAELGPGAGSAAWTTVTSIAQGVENFEIEYGINTNDDHMDTTGTRMPNVFVADPYNTITQGTAGCTALPCPSNLANTVAIQLNLLVRNPTATIGFNDTKTYNLGTVSVTPGGNYKRHAYTQEVMLWNPSIR